MEPKGLKSQVEGHCRRGPFFAVLVFQLAAGIVSHSDVDRFRLGANITASLMLAIVWRYIRKFNRSARRLLQAEIDDLDKKAEAES